MGQRPLAPPDAMTPKEIFGILRRHVLLISSFSVLGLIVGGTSWYLLRRYSPKYTAETYIKVLPPVEKDPMTISGTQVSKDIQYGSRLSMAGLIKQQSTLQSLVERDKIRETKWFKDFGEVKDKSIARAVKDLRKRFVASAQRDGDYVRLAMTCGDKREAALIVNEMVSLFIASQGSTKKEEIAEKLARLEDQRVRVQRDLDSAEKALKDVRERWGFTDLEESDFEHTITRKLNALELDQSEILLEMNQIGASIQTLKKQAIGPVNEQVSQQIENDPIMVMLAQQLALQEAQLSGKLTKFGENHRVVRQTQEQINEIIQRRIARKAEIAEQTRQSNLKNAQDSMTVMSSKFEEMEKLRKEAEAKKRDLDLARIQYAQRVTIRDEREDMLDSVKSQVEKLKIMHDDPETPKVQFVGYAPVPLEMSSPKWQMYLPGGLMLGLMFGVGLVFLVELLNDLVRTPKDISKFLHISLLGVIPDAAEDDQLRKVNLCHVVRQAPYSIVSEAYRRFRTNLKLSVSAGSSRVLLVASGMAGDGKTSVAVNLATTFAAENKKVLLIDTNFWRPNLHTIFPNQQSEDGIDDATERADFGLSDLLTGGLGFGDVVRSSGIKDFDVIVSGSLPSNPAELLGSEQMERLIKQQREIYDYIIVDGPPVLLVTDAKILARIVDGTILVFNAAATKRGAAQRTIRELKEVDALILGCVLFAVKAMKGGYFHEQFNAYQEYQKLQLAQTT